MKLSANNPCTTPIQLRGEEKIVSWISEITGQSGDNVRRRLWAEFKQPGINVANAFKETGLQPHVWCDEMPDFYRQTDAFVYELVIWNLNRLKNRFRRWVKRYLDSCAGEKRTVLCIGDGLGFDSAYLKAGYQVTYFESPSFQLSFAERVFAETPEAVTVITDENDIPLNMFDAVICLDVLEHIPKPALFVRKIAKYLKPQGWLIVHAPFYMVHSSKPTHLKANRRYSGSLSLYQKEGFRLIEGKGGWSPIVLEKTGGNVVKQKGQNLKLFLLRLMGLGMCAGRFIAWPYYWINIYQKRRGEWFSE